MKRRTQVAISSVLALGGVYLLADAFDLTPGVLTTRPHSVEVAAYPTIDTTGVARPTLPSLNPQAPVPDANAVQAAVTQFVGDSRLSGSASVEVVDTATGNVLASADAATGRVPASNMKVVTAAAALEALGPGTTLPTTAKLSGSSLYIVGGGDTLLAAGVGDENAVKGRAGLGDLAAAVATKLAEQGVTSVSVFVDSSLFGDPLYHPDVTGGDTGYVMQMRPIAVMQSRNASNQYTADPDVQAGQVFADALAGAGIAATFEGRSAAPADAADVASVESASLRELVDFMLTESDNTTAEVLGHLVAVKAGRPGTFEGAAGAVTEVMTKAGYDMSGVVISDNSGLAISNRLTTGLLVNIFDKLYACEGCELDSIASGLPVMGLNGTLSSRENGTGLSGRIHAKTGTLVTANALSGYLLTEKGRLLTFSILVDGIAEGSTASTRPIMDELLTTISGL
ncbi:D-alanyl-D-alanine carboxypeptidase/D-alanyl-D-alanine-endopeptidase [Arcanobacterium haemolyticum]|nr:D-alanyl-D-alanine carboxypeptidase/D-alanyl-D-alanine-endopeptidase [Arcanobacterium haemolyticum]